MALIDAESEALKFPNSDDRFTHGVIQREGTKPPHLIYQCPSAFISGFSDYGVFAPADDAIGIGFV